jgi:hypothetical protein
MRPGFYALTDKRCARLNLISHFLSLILYKAPRHNKVKLPNRDKKTAYDDEVTIKDRRDKGDILRHDGTWTTT